MSSPNCGPYLTKRWYDNATLRFVAKLTQGKKLKNSQQSTQSLLAHVASNFITQYENVANSSIAYLLNNYSAARDALQRVLEVEEVPRRYVAEEQTKELGRPDVVGRDESGDAAIIIEGKFWANLTDNQPNNYLEILRPTGGKLLFLAPTQRLESLQREIHYRLQDTKFEHHKGLVIKSWMDFLTRIEHENANGYDHALASDLEQIKALCDRMDVEGMPPLTDSDLDPMNGRVAYHLASIVDDVKSELSNWSYIKKMGSLTPHAYGRYFSFKTNQLTCYLNFLTDRWFLSHISTPFWLDISDNNGKRSDQIHAALHRHDSDKVSDEYQFPAYAIQLRAGMDKADAISHICESVKLVISKIESNDQ